MWTQFSRVILFALVSLWCKLCVGKGHGASARRPKFLPIFNIVHFSNTECPASNSVTSRNGTCLSLLECQVGGGTSQGTCAAGFGICCIFDKSSCGDAVDRNCSYVTNPEFPGPYAASESDTCSFLLRKSSPDICVLRLDFDTLSILGPPRAGDGGFSLCSADELIISNAAARSLAPSICGENTGQHIYVELNRGDVSDSALLTFSISASDSGTRRWQIKVTQFACNDAERPPGGCLQYHTELSGRITTFNFEDDSRRHLSDQQYSICLRQIRGFCCVVYEACQDVEDAFSISDITTSATDDECLGDYVLIEASSNVCNPAATSIVNKYCGMALNSAGGLTQNGLICDCTPPFVVGIFTDGDIERIANRGVCLQYSHRRCP